MPIQDIFTPPWLHQSAQYKIFFPHHTLFQFKSPSPSKPGIQPWWVACLLVCVSDLANIYLTHFFMTIQFQNFRHRLFWCRPKVVQPRGQLFSSTANLFGQEIRQILQGVGNLAGKLFCALELNICRGRWLIYPGVRMSFALGRQTVFVYTEGRTALEGGEGVGGERTWQMEWEQSE